MFEVTLLRRSSLLVRQLVWPLTRFALTGALLFGGCERDGATASPTAASADDPETETETASAAAEPVDAPVVEAEASVKPGINDSWKSDDVDPLVERLESETREVYAHRTALADLVAPEPGSVVADVGSGSGFMTQELAQRVGPDGKVYAVDINEKMLEKVRARVDAAKLGNVETVLTSDRGIELPAGSVDLMFICDTYHHFEYPKTVLGTIHQVLEPGAELVIVDFEKIEGETEDWIMQHVRASKEEVTREVTEAGFELVKEHDMPALEQNYVLRFRKPAG